MEAAHKWSLLYNIFGTKQMLCVCVIFGGGEGGALLVPDTSSTDQSKICTTVQLMQINS